MTIKAPFQPKYGSGQDVTAGAASASVSIGKGNKQIRIINTGNNPGHVRIGHGSQTASATDLRMQPGAVEVISKADDDDTLAHISALGTTLNIMLGEGW